MDTTGRLGATTAGADSETGHLPFACTWTDSGLGAAWVRVAGELDVATSPEVGRALTEAAKRAVLVVLDLREVTFMDCSGVHSIVDATSRARRDGRRVITVRGPAHVDKVFTLTDTREQIDLLDLHAAEPPIQVLLRAVTHPVAATSGQAPENSVGVRSSGRVADEKPRPAPSPLPQ